ncbi:hypothetical protein [Streptomyces sp. G45]|uniref:hypothetical protein n=1 Tax=Streptomyces sp. G45 TaxID=3406627 RepID=UPI003C21D714
MDPVVAGAGATVLVSVVSGVVTVVRQWLGREVELARVAHEAVTERVRHAGPRAVLRDTSHGARARVVLAPAASLPAPDEAAPAGIGGGRRGGDRQR